MNDLPDKTVRNIVIIGGGTAGWMTAAALACRLSGTGSSITLVESTEIGTVGVGEATLPQIRGFNQMLGIDEAEMMAKTSATIKLGIEFRDWGKLGDSYIHPFGNYGEAIGPAEFHHCWVRTHASGNAQSFEEYCLSIMAARAGKFALPPDNPSSVLDAYTHAFQFDASLYAAFLSSHAKDNGAVHVEGKVVEVATDSETGFIVSVTLETGEEISGDLFVDCSGFRGILIEQELETGYDDWSEYLPCNRAYAVPCEIIDPVRPFTRATARHAGWQWRIPLQHRIGNGHVYCDRYISDQDAVDQLMSTLEGKPLADPKQLFFKTGKRRKLWSKNCIAIGLSGGFLEPLESTSIDLIQSGIVNLLNLLPEKECAAADADEYNRLMDREYERVRDFLMLHYVATQREDGELWRDMRNMDWPDSLKHKIDAFKHRAIVPDYTHGLFAAASWLSVFIGQNIIPEHYDPRADLMADEALAEELGRIEKHIAQSAGQMTSHDVFIAEYGASFEGAAT